jgi:hypothetical protein
MSLARSSRFGTTIVERRLQMPKGAAGISGQLADCDTIARWGSGHDSGWIRIASPAGELSAHNVTQPILGASLRHSPPPFSGVIPTNRMKLSDIWYIECI